MDSRTAASVGDRIGWDRGLRTLAEEAGTRTTLCSYWACAARIPAEVVVAVAAVVAEAVAVAVVGVEGHVRHHPCPHRKSLEHGTF